MQPDENQKPLAHDQPQDTPSQPFDSSPPESAFTSPPTNPVPPVPSPVSPPQPSAVVGGFDSGYTGQAPGGVQPPVIGGGSPSSKKKKLLAMIAVVLLVLGGAGSAYYLAIFVPNKPESIWANALTNTGRGYDKLVRYADESKEIKGFKASGDFSVDDEDIVVDGSFTAAGLVDSFQANLNVGAMGERFSGDIRMVTPKGAKYADAYLRVKGLKGIAKLMSAGTSSPMIDQYFAKIDNQWIFIDHSLFNQLEKSAGAEPNGLATLSSDDYIEIARTAGEVNKAYLFTNDSEKAVFVIIKKVGKEKRDGRETYHFKAGYHKEHLKAYLKALKQALQQTKLSKVAPDGDLEKLIGFDDMIKELDKQKSPGTADVWVDTETRLFKAVRFTEKDHPDSYVEVGFDYTGGDDYPFVLRFDGGQQEQTSGELTVTLKPKTHTSTIKMDIESKGASSYKFTLNGTVEQTDEVPKVEKPEGAKSWTEVFGDLLGLYLPSGTYGLDCHISEESGTCSSDTNNSTVPSVRL